MSDDVLVTVVCMAYNHEKYIRDAIEGFVSQKTDFPYEILIHDDASTDKTLEIIREYEAKYANVRVIAEKNNMYSNKEGIIIGRDIVYPQIRGKYIAFCEGDDYWTDEHKLQTTVSYLEENPECSMCCHAYCDIVANTKEPIQDIHTMCCDGSIAMEQLILYKNPTQLASQVYRKDAVINRPELFYHRGVGDYTMLLYAATVGYIYYIDKKMAAHRISSDGSWTQRIYENNNRRIAHYNKMIEFLHDFDRYTKHRFSATIEERIYEYQYDIAAVKHDYHEQRKNPRYKYMPLSRRSIVLAGLLCPKIAARIEDYFKKRKKA